MDKSATVIEFKKRRPFDFFRKKKGVGALGAGKKAALLFFTGGLAAFLVLTALLTPEWVYAPFYAPVAVIIAVLFAVGLKKLLLRLEANRLHREVKRRSGEEPGGSGYLH